jgi:hypothetical protein
MSVIINGTTGISAPNVFGKNIIINGDGKINQRAYVSGTATSGANQYTLDRWKVVVSGENLTFTGTDAGRVMTAPAGGVEQVIEDKNIAGGTYVLDWQGTATATVDGNAVAKGGTFTLTANTNATVRFTSGTFSEVQVEQGSVATPFERRPYGTELALCQRYYYHQQATGTDDYFSNSHNASTTLARGLISFPVQMRIAPSALTQSGTAGDYRVQHQTTATNCSSVPTLSGGSVWGALVQFTVSSGLTAGQGSVIRSVNSSAYLGFSAEL